jgi:hypothetical protein
MAKKLLLNIIEISLYINHISVLLCPNGLVHNLVQELIRQLLYHLTIFLHRLCSLLFENNLQLHKVLLILCIFHISQSFIFEVG